MDVDTEIPHRPDGDAVRSRGERNWWAPVAALLVVAGYAAALVVGASARGSAELSDDAQVALVGTAPSLGVLGAVFAFVGTRRATLRAASWLVFGLGVLLVIVTLAALAVLVMALRELE